MATGTPYSDEQRELFRILVEDEKCTVNMIRDLLGIPQGSIPGLTRQAGIKFSFPRGTAGWVKSKTMKIQRARKLNILRSKYAKQIAELFPQK